MRFLRMFTNSLLAGGLSAAYLTVLVLQLNPHVPVFSATTGRWFLTLGATYGLHLAVAFYALIVTRVFFSMDTMSPGWASVRVLAWLSSCAAAVAATLMWLNLHAFRPALGEIAARRMTAGTLATSAAAIVLLGIAVAHYSYGRRGSRVGGALFSLAAFGSILLPLAARGPAVAPADAPPAVVVAPPAVPVAPPSVVVAPPPPAGAGRASRVIMLLLDGASLEYLRTRATEGRLPNLSRLLEAGASMYLATVRPTQPAPVWAAAASGMYPAKNGVRSAEAYYARGDTRALYLLPDHCLSYVLVRLGIVRAEPLTSDAWRSRPLWDILTVAGVPSGVVRWPLSFPALPTEGFMLTDRFHELLGSMAQFDARGAYPPEVLPAARQSFSETDGDSAELPGPVDAPEASAALRDHRYSRAMRDLQARRAVQVTALRLQGVDTAGHRHYDESQPSAFRDGSEAERRGRAQQLERAYAAVDREVGTAMGSLAPGDLLLVISGFGMQRLNPAKEVLAYVLRDPIMRGTHERAPDGFLLAYGTPVQQGRAPRGSIVDVAPTVLYFLGLPVGRDMDGFARTDLFTGAFTGERPIAFIATHDR
jgi:predicted AlkP superfamily phosphohydrolase/phosphomutase